MTDSPVTTSRRTLADVLNEIEGWVNGRRSWQNLGPYPPYTPDVIAAMDAQEVVKLAAYARLLADLEPGVDYRLIEGDDQQEIRGY